MRWPQKSRLWSVLAPATLAALIGNALVTSWWGLDYGGHWDEWYLFQGLDNAVKDLSLLPREYSYGGVYFAIGFLVLAPHLARLLPSVFNSIIDSPTRPLAVDLPAIVSAKTQLLQTIHQPEFLLQVRIIFVAIASLTAIWVYQILRRLFPGNAWSAVAGAGFIACSWENAYHSRFIAPDAILMQFGALTFLLITEALLERDKARSAGWLKGAAVAAGLTAGCKVIGIFILIPVLTAAFIVHRDLRSSFLRQLVSALVLLFIFCMSFFLTTPGSALDPIRFVGTLMYEARSYNIYTAGFPHFVADRFEHIWRMSLWLFGYVPSPLLALSIPLSAVTTVGLYALYYHCRKLFWCMATFVLPFAIFIASNHLLIVRNWLALIPLTAIAFGVGVFKCYELIHEHPIRWLAPFCIATIFGFNTSWLWYSAYTVRYSTPKEFAVRLATYMAAHPEKEFRLSSKTINFFRSHNSSALMCTDDDGTPLPEHAEIVLLANEHPWVQWLANRPNYVDLTISSLDVNYDYYPTWFGRNVEYRIVALRARNALKMKVDVRGFSRCSVN